MMNRLFGCAGFVLCLLGIAGCGTGPEAVELPLREHEVQSARSLRRGDFQTSGESVMNTIVALGPNPAWQKTLFFKEFHYGTKVFLKLVR